jgi:hypothetical protein
MFRLRSLTVLASFAALAACSTPIKTAHDSDPEADFSRYHSWAWISEESLIGARPGQIQATYVSPIDERRIRSAVERELAAKGYRKVAPAEADLIVSFSIGTQEKTKIYSTPNAGAGYYGYGYGGWYGGSTVRSYQYTEGTLAIEIFDREARRAVWVGWGSKRLSNNDDSEKVIDEAVKKILEPLPAPV